MKKRYFQAALSIFLCCLLIGSAVASPASPGTSTQPRKKLVVAVMDGPPWSMQDEDGRWTGISVELWREIAEILDVDYEFKSFDLEGILDAVEKGTADVSASGIAITSEREALCDFSDPYFVFNQTVAVNADQQLDLTHVLRTTFFSFGFASVILLMIAITILGGFVLWLLEHSANKSNGTNPDTTSGEEQHYGTKDTKAFLRAVFWSVMVLAGRDVPSYIGWKASPPKTFPGRLFAVVWMLFGVLLFSIFTASAASMLTSRQLQSYVASPDDLPKVKVGTVLGSAGQVILDRRKIKYAIYKSPKELVQALADHNIDAAVYGSTTLSYYAKSFNNRVVVLPFSLRQDFAALPVPNGSPLRKSINQAILKIIDSKGWQNIVSHYVTNDEH